MRPDCCLPRYQITCKALCDRGLLSAGWFPAQVTKPFVFSFMFYTLASILVKSIGHHPGKPSIRAMWFASVANNLFCPVYILALLKSPLLHFSFEVTPHGGA